MWPFKKKQKPQRKRMFAGAQIGRLTAGWIAQGTSLDQEIKGSLSALRNRSRQLCRDVDYAKNAKRLIRNNVIGTGIVLQSQVRMKRKTKGGDSAKLNDAVNQMIEDAWYRWGRKENCHAAGKLCFSDIERHLMESVFESGEALVRMITRPMGSMRIPLTLEIIDPDLLDESYNLPLSGGRQIRMGVEMDEWKRPVAYHFLPKHPGEYDAGGAYAIAGKRIRVPADELIHLFEGAQTRGVPWLHSAIIRMHHMHGYEEAEVIAARVSASLMGFIESPEGDTAPLNDDVVAGDRVTDFEPGTVKALGPGEHFNMANPGRPGGQFDPFMRLMLRGVASGIGVSYEGLSKDYSQSNYSSSRLALLDDRDNWKVLQSWIIENFHQVVFERWLDLAVLSGELAIPDYFENLYSYQACRWRARGWSWIDPAKEVAAYTAAVRSGFKTQADVIGEGGGDYEEYIAQRKREVEIAKEAGLAFDTDPAKVNGQGALQALAEANKPAPEAPPKK